MSDKIQSAGQSAGQPPIKIGHYLLAETLGIGSFGKVKSKCGVNGVLYEIKPLIL